MVDQTSLECQKNHDRNDTGDFGENESVSEQITSMNGIIESWTVDFVQLIGRMLRMIPIYLR